MNKFKPGTLVWVRMRSYPWWPAEVVSEDEPGISEEVIAEKKSGTYLVRFFGEANFAWSLPQNIVRFRRKYEAYSKNNTRGLRNAIKEALETEKERGREPESESEEEAKKEEGEGKKRKREESESDGKEASGNGNGDQPPKRKRGRPKKSDTTAPKRKHKPDEEEEGEDEGKKEGSKKAKSEKQGGDKGERSSDKDDERRKRRKLDREERRKKKKEKDNELKHKDPSAFLLAYNKHLRKATAENNEARVSQILKKLKNSTDIVTIKSIHESGLGKTVKRLTKHKSTEVQDLAKELLAVYMAVMDDAIATGDIGKLNLQREERRKAEEAKAADKKNAEERAREGQPVKAEESSTAEAQPAETAKENGHAPAAEENSAQSEPTRVDEPPAAPGVLPTAAEASHPAVETVPAAVPVEHEAPPAEHEAPPAATPESVSEDKPKEQDAVPV